jgi:hypothetical protein
MLQHSQVENSKGKGSKEEEASRAAKLLGKRAQMFSKSSCVFD